MTTQGLYIAPYYNKSEIVYSFKKKKDTMALMNCKPHIVMYSKD